MAAGDDTGLPVAGGAVGAVSAPSVHQQGTPNDSAGSRALQGALEWQALVCGRAGGGVRRGGVGLPFQQQHESKVVGPFLWCEGMPKAPTAALPLTPYWADR